MLLGQSRNILFVAKLKYPILKIKIRENTATKTGLITMNQQEVLRWLALFIGNQKRLCE